MGLNTIEIVSIVLGSLIGVIVVFCGVKMARDSAEPMKVVVVPTVANATAGPIVNHSTGFVMSSPYPRVLTEEEIIAAVTAPVANRRSRRSRRSRKSRQSKK
jgi:hypothetical protein